MRTLRTFLDDPARPSGTLTYFEAQGFLLAVASAPDLIRPSEWLPVIFNEQGAGYASIEEAQAILNRLTLLYNEINAAVLEDRATLPSDCRMRRRVLDNLKPTAPVARWAQGFVCGHQWLENLWEAPLPGELDEEVGAVLMTLSFFSSPELARAYHAEGQGGRSLEDMAGTILRLLPEAVSQYAHLGRRVLPALTASDPEVQSARRVATPGRNEPCPCGSGKKFKRCCGAPAH